MKQKVVTAPLEGEVGKDETKSGGENVDKTPAAETAPSNQNAALPAAGEAASNKVDGAAGKDTALDLSPKDSVGDTTTPADTEAGNNVQAKDVVTAPPKAKVGKDETKSGGEKIVATDAAGTAASNQADGTAGKDTALDLSPKDSVADTTTPADTEAGNNVHGRS